MICKLRKSYLVKDGKNMKEIKALILGVGGNVSQGIIKAIRKSDLNVKIIGACVSAESLGLYMCDEAYISPYASDQKFIPWLINICNDLSIDIVLTGVEENICEIEKILIFLTSPQEPLSLHLPMKNYS